MSTLSSTQPTISSSEAYASYPITTTLSQGDVKISCKSMMITATSAAKLNKVLKKLGANKENWDAESMAPIPVSASMLVNTTARYKAISFIPVILAEGKGFSQRFLDRVSKVVVIQPPVFASVERKD